MEWNSTPLERVDPHFPDVVIACYDDALKETERAVFELPADIRRSLRKSARLFLSRKSGMFSGGSCSVIAGMGEVEHFPSLLHCYAGPIVKGRVRLDTLGSTQITASHSACVIPFAQRATIDTIITGINSELRDDLPGFVSDSIDQDDGKPSHQRAFGSFAQPRELDQKVDDRILAVAKKNAVVGPGEHKMLVRRLEYCELRELQDTIPSKALWLDFESPFVNREALNTKFRSASRASEWHPPQPDDRRNCPEGGRGRDPFVRPNRASMSKRESGSAEEGW